MNLMSLENYRVRSPDVYYDKGFYLADVISMHNVVSEFEEISVEFDFIDEKDILGRIASHEGREIVRYNPFTLYETKPEDLFYVVAHEIAHIKNDDNGRIKALRFMAFSIYAIMFVLGVVIQSLDLILRLFGLFLIVMLSVLCVIIAFSVYRWLETMADIGALKYIGKSNVLEQIKGREPRNKGRWLYFDHATTKSFTKWYMKKDRNDDVAV